MDGVYLNNHEKNFDRDTFGIYAKSLERKGLVTLFETEESGPEMISLTTLGFKEIQALLKK